MDEGTILLIFTGSLTLYLGWFLIAFNFYDTPIKRRLGGLFYLVDLLLLINPLIILIKLTYLMMGWLAN